MAARGEAPPSTAPTPMGMDMSTEPDMDMDDDFEGDPAAAGEPNATGRELKAESLDSMERQAVKEQRVLKAKKKVLEMVKTQNLSKEQYKKIMTAFR
jgi:hypothetical protein